MREMNMGPKLLIFASGTAHGGGSGFENLVQATRTGTLGADIVGVISNHEHGGVRERANRLRIPFGYLSTVFKPPSAYRALVDHFKPDFIALSGWMLRVEGLDPRTTFNIHPGPLPHFGGKGMYGDRVHAAVLESFRQGQITHSAVTMHFVDGEYDTGPVFFEQPVPIEADDTVETLRSRVNKTEHAWQPRITQLVLSGTIYWDGKNPASLQEG
jgi:phosphoribosylglycinamide formyltransferase-1